MLSPVYLTGGLEKPVPMPEYTGPSIVSMQCEATTVSNSFTLEPHLGCALITESPSNLLMSLFTNSITLHRDN